MPPLPTIAGTFRITFLWSVVDGVTPRNVIHMRRSAGTVTEVVDAIDAGIANAASPSHLFHCCDDAQVCTSINVLPLDGTSAGVVASLATNLTGGSGTGDTIPQGAGIVSFYTLQRGPSGRGRLFAGPISEAAQVNGVLSATSRGLMGTAWDDFQAGAQGAADPANHVVASYAHATAYTVVNADAKQIIGTQRRRVEQLR